MEPHVFFVEGAVIFVAPSPVCGSMLGKIQTPLNSKPDPATRADNGEAQSMKPPPQP